MKGKINIYIHWILNIHKLVHNEFTKKIGYFYLV